MGVARVEHPYSRRRLDGLVGEIEAALASGDRQIQSDLVQRSTDLLVKRWSCLPPEGKPAFDALLSALLTQVNIAARTGFAEGLSRLRRGPPRTSSSLARDADASVAAPLLSRCGGLDAATLAEVALSREEGHRAAMAGRAALPQDLTDILLAHGGAQVAGLLLGNPGAAFSADGFAHLVRHARASEAVALGLALRPELPGTQRASLRRLARERAAESLAADAVPDIRSAALLDQVCLPQPDGKRLDRFAASMAFVEKEFAAAAPPGGALMRWLGLNRIEDVLAALAHRANLPVGFVVAAYDSQDGTMLALVMTGCGYSWPVVKTLLQFRHGREDAYAAIERAHALARQLSPLSARRLVRLAALPLPAAAFGPNRADAWDEFAETPRRAGTRGASPVHEG